MSQLATYLSLAKPRVLVLMVIAALTAALVAGQGGIPLRAGLLLVLSGVLASSGATFLNHYLDRDIDAIMERTKNRPLPSGRVSPTLVLLAGTALILLSLPIAWQLNYQVTTFVLSGALIYSLLYTLWLKRKTPLNIVIGGLAGSCAVLAGWFAISRAVSLLPLLLALLVFLWTPSHFWSFALVHQESYQKASIPMLPVLAGAKKTSLYILVSTVLVLLVSLLLYFLDSFGEIYLIGLVLLGVLYLGLSIRLYRQPTKERAWKHFKFAGIFLFGLFVVMVVDVLVQ